MDKQNPPGSLRGKLSPKHDGMCEYRSSQQPHSPLKTFLVSECRKALTQRGNKIAKMAIYGVYIYIWYIWISIFRGMFDMWHIYIYIIIYMFYHVMYIYISKWDLEMKHRDITWV